MIVGYGGTQKEEGTRESEQCCPAVRTEKCCNLEHLINSSAISPYT